MHPSLCWTRKAPSLSSVEIRLASRPVTHPALQDGVTFVVNVFRKDAYQHWVLPALAHQQGSFARELIFVDGSADQAGLSAARAGTAGWSGWSDIRFLAHADRGPANAANLGAALARHRCLRFIDGDDIIAPDSTATLMAIQAETKAGFVISPTRYVPDFDTLTPTPMTDAHRVPSDGLAEVIRRTVSNMSGTLFDTAAFLAAGGCDERIFIHDFSAALRVARTHPVALADSIGWYGLSGDQTRIMTGSKHQLFHDYNAVLWRFLADHPDLPRRYQTLAFRRAAGRAYKWAHREEGVVGPSRYLYLSLRAHAPWGANCAEGIRQTLAVFSRTRPVRVPGV